jgi:hypothetical protein
MSNERDCERDAAAQHPAFVDAVYDTPLLYSLLALSDKIGRENYPIWRFRVFRAGVRADVALGFVARMRSRSCSADS